MGGTYREYCIILKTRIGLEKVVASRVKEEYPYLLVEHSPEGFQGLVLVGGCINREKELSTILSKIPEIENGFAVRYTVPAELESIVEASRRLASEVKPDQCFAVRTVRRGNHSFTSIDVNTIVGSVIKEATGACVDLEAPDVVVGVEIIGDIALLTVYPGTMLRKKYYGKRLLYPFLSRISAVQMPYISPDKNATRKMGVRIGREVQNFELKELVIAFDRPVDAFQLRNFIDGVEEGIESRYRVQVKSYGRKARRVPVRVYDIFQLVRARYNEPIIVLEPEGEHVTEAKEELLEIFRKKKRVNILAGSREGVPSGIYRVADAVIDIAPGITLSTEYALAAGLIAIATVLYEWVGEFGGDTSNFSGR